MILCFHELGLLKQRYVCPILDFKKLVEINSEDEIHFDDGRKGILLLEPAYLANIASRTTIFLVPNFIKGMIPDQEKYSEFLDYADIENLIKMGFEIGSHSLTHCDLTILPITQLKHELEFSKKWLEDRFDIKVTKFSYPFGRIVPFVKWEAEKIYKKCYSLDSLLGIKRKCVVNDIP